jgi:DNA-binding PadR family transcriptional regulator
MNDERQTRVSNLFSSGTKDEKKRAVPLAASRMPDIAFYILGLVAEHPDGIHGYALMRAGRPAPFAGQSMVLTQLYRRLERLQGQGFLRREVEASGPRLRYLFSITARGETALRKWLSSPVATTEGVIERLRFASRLPRAAVLGMLESADRHIADTLTRFRKSAEGHEREPGEGDGLWIRAVEARLDADRQWLQVVRRSVVDSTPHLRAAPAAACI